MAATGFGLQVVRLRQGAKNAVAFFDVNFGTTNSKGDFQPLVTAKDFVLKKTKTGDLFFKPPAKPRLKNGEPVKGDDGYAIYDPLIDIYIEKGAGKNGGWGPTKASASVKQEILKQAEAQLEALQTESTGRGTARVTGVDDDDTDLPFN